MAAPSLADLHALRQRLSTEAFDQGHLFVGWPQDAAAYSPAQVALLAELHGLSKTYPGGVEQYIRNGRRLLEADRITGGADGGTTSTLKAVEMPSLVFKAPDVFQRSPELTQLESEGAERARKTAFVLVAGGLGERLGYSSIKVGLPVETATMRTYLGHYLEWAKAVAGPNVSFVIMTSDDTHASTLELLATLQPNMPNLRLLKQETVFCFADADAHLALAKDGTLPRKPHGHGDVHSLLFAAKATEDEGGAQRLIDRWLSNGLEHVVFFQDTDAPATITMPISLALSTRNRLDMSFTCIPRQPREAIGLLCRTLRSVVDVATGNAVDAWRTSIVEYNVLETEAKMLMPDGDVAAKGSEFSAFPGSINTLVFNLSSYAKQLTLSQGAVPEFINPKYTDASRRSFKKPARVESLMQDFALLFPEADFRVGGVVFDRFLYQPVKNALPDACEKARQGMNPYCAATGEADYYELMRRRVRAVGVALEPRHPVGSPPDVVVGGVIETNVFPIVTLDAATGADGLAGFASVFPQPSKVKISPGSTLMIEGKVTIESLEVDGAVRIAGPPRASSLPPLVVRDLKVKNGAWGVRETTSDDVTEVDRIRGFVLQKTPPQVVDSQAKL